MFGPEDSSYDLERDFIYTRKCPICGERMYPIFGGYCCEECDFFDWRRGIILKGGNENASTLVYTDHPVGSNLFSIH